MEFPSSIAELLMGGAGRALKAMAAPKKVTMDFRPPPTPTVDQYVSQPGLTRLPDASPVIPQTSPSPSRDQLLSAMTKGWEHYGNPPAATLSGNMLDAEGSYPIFQKYPFLLAALSILESGGGGNMSNRQSPYNLTSWGINLPKDMWNPQSPEEVLNKTGSGIGERMAAYEPFRKSGDLNDLANVYAPLSDNPTTGGPTYAKNAQDIMDVFRSYLQQGR